MFSDEQRFVWDVDSLWQIADNPTIPNLLEASGILRRLYMDDGVPLLHKVARRLEMKALFTVLEKSTPSDWQKMYDQVPVKRGLKHLFFNPNTEIYPTAAKTEVPLDKFLNMPFSQVDGQSITVMQIISYCANVAGGVHKGEPRKKHNAETIHATANTFGMNGAPYPIAYLHIILRMSLPALMPLYERLRA